MPIYDVKISHWVEVNATDPELAKQIVADNLNNGVYNDSFEGFAEITEVEEVADEA
jgi:hypothetical protein